MDRNNRFISEQGNRKTKKTRVDAIKVAIIVIVVSLLVIPTMCCLILFIQMNRMQKQIAVLIEVHQEEFEKSSKQDDDDSLVVYAAEVGKGSITNADDEKQVAKDSIDADEKQKSLPAEEAEDLEQQKKEKNVKYADDLIEGAKVYLTFDDGPSKYTDEILDILAEYDVKATFFVIGKTDEKSKERYQRIADEGHTLAMHSYTHQYSKIYGSLKSFEDDFEKIRELLYETTGVEPIFYRFPGGSSNTVSKVDIKKLISYFNKNDIVYFDWNVVNGDATGQKISSKEMLATVKDGIKGIQSSVVLMHDTDQKKVTVDTLPKIIEELKEQEITFLPITKETKPIQHIKAESVN